RTDVQDRTAANSLHARRHRLRAKELMAQVDRHALVPVLRAHLRSLVTVVIGGIVDQDAGRAALALDLGKRLAERIQIGQVAMHEPGWMAHVAQRRRECARRLLRDIEEKHLASLAGESLRSEERRVGKECRTRWGEDDER